MNYKILNDKKIWLLEIINYAGEYRKYFDANKVAVGLGDDINLSEYMNSNKELIHKSKAILDDFMTIKRGDYIAWYLYERKNEINNTYVQKNFLLGQVMGNIKDIYKYEKEIGHTFPVNVIERYTQNLYNYEDINCTKIDEIKNGYDDFKALDKFNVLNDKNENYYFRISYFGMENIAIKKNMLIINLSNFKVEQNDYLEQVRKMKRGDFILGEFISKRDALKVSRAILKVNQIDFVSGLKIVADIINMEQNKDCDYAASIGLYDVSQNRTFINCIENSNRKYNNTISYGPPGTGKTYSVNTEVLKIVDPHILNTFNGDRNKINDEMIRLQSLNQVNFCTFHQSYGYEEFIEGLRPDDRGNYKLEDGLLKKMSIEAMFEGLIYELKYEFLLKEKSIPQDRLYEEKKRLVLRYINNRTNFDFTTCEQYVLVIDEINRGNISKIFGELITLLEEDKRLSLKNELILKLPYSKEDFALPPNLHVIGTMNSSDKSIAPIDIALRRRFRFVEVMPDESLLKIVDGINLRVLLKRINDRIEYLYDRDHTIGHAYFINNTSIVDIKNTILNKIVPLLQEYFYEDYDKIGLVLGGIGDSINDRFVVYKQEINPNDLFHNALEYDFEPINKYFIKNNISYKEIKSIYE